MSGDKKLIEAFQNENDIHSITAAAVLGKNETEISSEERSQAKAINYGLIYGMGPVRLAKTTGTSVSKAKEFIEKYFQQFPSIKDYIDNTISSAEEIGYCQTMSGRKRWRQN